MGSDDKGIGAQDIERIRALTDGKVFLGFTPKEVLVIKLLAKNRASHLAGEIDIKDETVVAEKRELLPVYNEIVRRIEQREAMG